MRGLLNQNKWRVRLWGSLAVAAAGCTHALQINNTGAYYKIAHAPKRLAIRLVDASLGDGQQLFQATYEALRTHPDVADVLLKDQEPERATDATVTLRTTTKYDGSGWNYLITFPGFILFTHAWNGFVYKADVSTEVEVALNGNANKTAHTIDTSYDLRHCDFGRGAAASSGWYLPGWGGTNLIVGLFMISYDTDVTPEFLEKVRPTYGAYIANSVVEAIGSPAPAVAPAAAADRPCFAG